MNQATATSSSVVIVGNHAWARSFSLVQKNFLDRKLIKAYTCTFAFLKV
jgi:hypothetical protein